MNPKISVIIPAYNAEETLKRCLDSVFASDFLDDMEIILVNDGSIDGTLEVARHYQGRPGFSIVNQSNRGETRARWTGICLSRGDFLGFVDADDYIAPDMFSKMYGRMSETGADMVVCGVYRVIGEETIQTFSFEEDVAESKEAAIERVILDKVNGYLCNKLYSRNLMARECYKFTFDISYCGDLLLNHYVMRNVNRVAFLEEALYYYVASPGSITLNLSTRAMKDALYVKETLREDYSVSETPRWRQLYAGVYLRGMIGTLRSLDGKGRGREADDMKLDVKRRIKSVKLREIWSVSSRRQIFDYILVRLGLFEPLYYLWDRPSLAPLRQLRRRLLYSEKCS